MDYYGKVFIMYIISYDLCDVKRVIYLTEFQRSHRKLHFCSSSHF